MVGLARAMGHMAVELAVAMEVAMMPALVVAMEVAAEVPSMEVEGVMVVEGVVAGIIPMEGRKQGKGRTFQLKCGSCHESVALSSLNISLLAVIP